MTRDVAYAQKMIVHYWNRSSKMSRNDKLLIYKIIIKLIYKFGAN